MTHKPGRNDPCPCGSGKKYKQCCFMKDQPGRKKFKASVLSRPKGVDLMERTFGNGIAKTKESDRPLAQRVHGNDRPHAQPAHDASENDKPVTL